MNNEEEYQIKCFTHEQAVTSARQQATRDLSETAAVISYIAFVPSLEDFCHCEFRLEAPHGWVHSCRMLTAEERRFDETITDFHIRQIALSGNMISAIRLYRGKYSIGLAEGKMGVERLLYENQ